MARVRWSNRGAEEGILQINGKGEMKIMRRWNNDEGKRKIKIFKRVWRARRGSSWKESQFTTGMYEPAIENGRWGG